jgi:hypothetical protein
LCYGDANYCIHLAYSFEKSTLKIKVKYKLQLDSEKEDIIFIVKQSIEGNQLYYGYSKLKGPLYFVYLVMALLRTFIVMEDKNYIENLQKRSVLHCV